MSDELQTAETKLRQLGQRVRSGLARLHPPTPQQLAKVRAAVRQQWEATHRGQAQAEGSQTVSRAKKTKPQQQSKSKSQDRSQDHGHSY